MENVMKIDVNPFFCPLPSSYENIPTSWTKLTNATMVYKNWKWAAIKGEKEQ